MNYYIMISIIFIFGSFCTYADSLYPLNTAKKTAQFNHLLKNFRCLVCQNQDLSDSNTQLAKNLKIKVYHMVEKGNSDAEIINYLTTRYGDFILFKPPVKPLTVLLWFGPCLFLSLGIIVFWRSCKYNL